MAKVKLFGGSRSASRVATRGKKQAPQAEVPSEAVETQETQKPQKTKKPLKTLAIILTVILCLEGLYFFCIYTENSFVKYYRETYIRTAMSTMRHQWLATYFIPADVIEDVQTRHGNQVGAQIGKESSWSKPEENPENPMETSSDNETKPEETSAPTDPKIVEVHVEPTEPPEPTPEELEAAEREAFYELFWELDRDTMEAYIEEHPDVLNNGWSKIYINEAGLDDEGTSIRTTIGDEGEQVLAIDAENQILLVREKGQGYRGVLAVCKDPSRLCIEMAPNVGVSPQKGKSGAWAGQIAEANDGLLAMTASGFVDIDDNGNEGAGNGGLLAGYTMANGEPMGSHFHNWAYKRVELHKDNLLYITDALSNVSEECTDATEFQPALIIDGQVLVDGYWTENNPRAMIGQSDKYEILMMVIEGRRPLLGIIGTDVNTCSWILKKHNCMQAMNVDGGTSAIMWFDGEYVTLCSNAKLEPEGRPLPNAWVYKKTPIEEE